MPYTYASLKWINQQLELTTQEEAHLLAETQALIDQLGDNTIHEFASIKLKPVLHNYSYEEFSIGLQTYADFVDITSSQKQTVHEALQALNGELRKSEDVKNKSLKEALDFEGYFLLKCAPVLRPYKEESTLTEDSKRLIETIKISLERIQKRTEIRILIESNISKLNTMVLNGMANPTDQAKILDLIYQLMPYIDLNQ